MAEILVLAQKGAIVSVSGENILIQNTHPTDAWIESDVPTVSQMQQYLSNVNALRETLVVFQSTPLTPETMEKLTTEKANNIEQILVDIEQLIRWMIAGYVRSSAPSFYSGSSPLPTENVDKGRTWAELDALGYTWEQVDNMTWFQLLYI